jgi:hypothetical protein
MWRQIVARLALCVMPAAGSAASAEVPTVPSLCTPQEVVVFSCRIEGWSRGKVASLCIAATGAGEPPRVQYRFGTPKHIELQFPATPEPAGEHFWLSTAMYSGGGAARIRFRHADTDYILFDQTVRTGFGSGPNNPQFTAGVATRAGGKLTSVRKCTASTPLAYSLIPGLKTEDFDHDLLP